VIFMSDNSFKSKARREQKATGSSYMRARRAVDNGGGAGAVGGVPMSADAAKMLSLLGLHDAEWAEVRALWADRALPVGTGELVEGPLLRVPLGLRAGGEPVWFDLTTGLSSGLLTGSTGSGKSAFLRTLMFGLLAQYSAEQLQVVYVSGRGGCDEYSEFVDYPQFTRYPVGPSSVGGLDYKSALNELMADRTRALRAADAITLHHEGVVSFVDDGAVSWAYDGLAHVDTAMAQLGSEDARERTADEIERLVRGRAEFARELAESGRGSFSFEPAGSIGRYNQVRATAAGAELPPVPCTVVVVDEWIPLVINDPESRDVLTALVRDGRSLGIHAVLASQEVGGHRFKPITESVGWRLALRLNDMATSREAIGSEAAYKLPLTAGVGVLRPRADADLVTFRGFLLQQDWVREVGRRLAAAGS
jgi:hypothetical protein